MPPKAGGHWVKAKGKAKGRGKGKAKAKAKVQWKWVPDPVAEGAEGAEVEVGETALAVHSPSKPKSAGLRKKLLGDLGERTIDEAVAEQKNILATADATIAEATALDAAQEAQVQTALAEYEQAKSAVEEAIAKEAGAASKYRELKERQQNQGKGIDVARKNLMDAQKKVALIELQAMNDRKMKELEEKRKAATEAADAAKRHLAEQRQKEKEALQATRKALEEARALKGGGAGAAKRAPAPAASSPKKARMETQDTVPATLVDGEDIE